MRASTTRSKGIGRGASVRLCSIAVVMNPGSRYVKTSTMALLGISITFEAVLTYSTFATLSLGAKSGDSRSAVDMAVIMFS